MNLPVSQTDTRKCNHCGEVLPLINFRLIKRKRLRGKMHTYREKHCMKCKAEYCYFIQARNKARAGYSTTPYQKTLLLEWGDHANLHD